MPRVALTKEQKLQHEVNDIYKAIVDGLNAERGKARMSDGEFAKVIGISRPTFWRWSNGKIDRAELGLVIPALLRAGISVKIGGTA